MNFFQTKDEKLILNIDKIQYLDSIDKYVNVYMNGISQYYGLTEIDTQNLLNKLNQYIVPKTNQPEIPSEEPSEDPDNTLIICSAENANILSESKETKYPKNDDYIIVANTTWRIIDEGGNIIWSITNLKSLNIVYKTPTLLILQYTNIYNKSYTSRKILTQNIIYKVESVNPNGFLQLDYNMFVLENNGSTI